MRISWGVLSLFILASNVRCEDWPQWMGPQRDGVWRESGIVRQFPEAGPKILWRKPVGSGYAGPAVANGKVYVADYVKTFGDDRVQDFKKRNRLHGKERLLCLDAKDGSLLWKHEYSCPYEIAYPSGPRCTPNVSGGKVYALGAMGHLFCFDANDGAVVWSKELPKDYNVKAPLYGYSGHPLVAGKNVICVVGGQGTTAVAFDKMSGKEVWRSLSSNETGYSPPTLIEAGGCRQLLIWHGESLNALDPDTGTPYWSVPLTTWMGTSVMAPRKDGEFLFAAAVYGTAIALRLDPQKPAASEVWRGSRNPKNAGLFPMNMTPFLAEGVAFGVDQPGQFRALDVATGRLLWESWLPVTGKSESRPVYTGTAFVVRNADRFFLFNELGEIVIAKMSSKSYEEISRAKIIDPTSNAFGRVVVWSHPAFADRCVFVRNDRELVCASLAE